MDFEKLLFFGFLWFVFNLLRGTGKMGSGTKRPPVAKRDPAWGPSPQPSPTHAQSRPLPASAGADPTQREGGRLEGLLRDLNRSLEEATRAKEAATGAAKAQPRPADDTPEAISLEGETRRASRADIDQDDSAEQIVARRIADAEARNTVTRSAEHTAADHRAFDRRIRQEPADHTAVRARTYTPKQLSDAIVWREILGPPVSLRDSTSASRPGDIG